MKRPSNRVAPIPEGYGWCMSCSLLTPHVPVDAKKRPYYTECVLCGEDNIGDGCPNCGWFDEALVEGALAKEAIKHHKGCHYHESWEVETDYFFSQPYATHTASAFFRKNFGHIMDNLQNLERDKVMRLYFKAINESCGCPRFMVYDNLNVWHRWSHQDREGEWSGGMEVKCPICGQEFTYEF